MTNLRIFQLCWTMLALVLSGCSSHRVEFIHPQTGATALCSASGFGINASFCEELVSGCGRAYEERGYVKLEQLTPEQRTALEKRGLLPKN